MLGLPLSDIFSLLGLYDLLLFDLLLHGDLQSLALLLVGHVE